MKTRRSLVPNYYEILVGGPHNVHGLQLSKTSHREGYIRRSLFVQNAITLCQRAGLQREDMHLVKDVIHSPSPLLGNPSTPWNYAVISNLQFYFASSVLRKSISELSNKDVDLTPEEKKNMEERLRPLVDFGCDRYSNCDFH
jgi:hypothetical protein